MPAIRTVFIVDDHPIVRNGLVQAINADGGLRVIGEAGDAATALAQISALKPDIAVLDVSLRGASGIELAEALRQGSQPVAVVMLTMHNEEKIVQAALDKGVLGYVLKDNALQEITQAVHAAARGEIYLSPAVSRHLVTRGRRAKQLESQRPELASLTAMERRILKMISENKTSKEIAERLFISPRTVETHRANICGKLQLKGAHPLLQFALAHKADL